MQVICPKAEECVFEGCSHREKHQERTFCSIVSNLCPQPCKPVEKEKEMFMVFVAGKQTPRAMHDSEQSARQEAERLANLNVGDWVMVLKIVTRCISETTVSGRRSKWYKVEI